MKVSKALIESASDKYIEFIMRLDRKHTKLLVSLLTGHGATRYMWYKIGVAKSGSCRYCGEEEETSIHILCHCPAIAGKRRETLGLEYPAPDEIKGMELSSVLALALKVRLMS